MEFPEPVIEIAIEPKSKADQGSASRWREKLAAEDPSFRVDRPWSDQTIPSRAWANSTLDIKVDILKRTYKVGTSSARRR